ncbi:MAG: DUF2490 domain-containing protein [Bacteroidales bacterium]|nr:DUF2490 domain-containing protein [Bacteroidales bacterium]MCF8333369.1 DUF2490 domain-containing protein [Bacteroidales bacterium]
MKKHTFFLLIFLFSLMKMFAQDFYETGLLPKFNINTSINELWELNAKSETKVTFLEGNFGGYRQQELLHQRTELAFAAERKTTYNSSLAGGYLIRFHNKKPAHRLFQQYSIVSSYATFKLGHRFSADQTFKTGGANEYRLRYRISTALPLEGTQIDPTESYLKFNNEYLGGLQEKEYNLEIRALAAIGKNIGNNQKVEAGLNYRIGKVFQESVDHEFWLYLAFYLNT